MKTTFTTLLLIVLCLRGSAQYMLQDGPDGRRLPTVKQTELSRAKLVTEVSQDLWQAIVLPFKSQLEQDHHYRLDNMSGHFMYPQVYNYNKLIDYVSVEISALHNGQLLIATAPNEVLTSAQKEILRTADPGTDIRIKLKYSYKNQSTVLRVNNKVVESSLTVTVVPATEAEYPGGWKQVKKYLTDNVVSRIPENGKADKLQALAVRFTIDEQGRVVDPIIASSSGDKALDALLINMLSRMPRWQPAQDAKGYKVKQEFKLLMGQTVGC